MINNLKIAVKKHKKLIALFLLTIFLPSLVLSIFGIRAIWNEQFRVEQQYENEHRRIADFLKTNIISRLNAIEIMIKNLVIDPAFSKNDHIEINELLNNNLIQNNLIEQAIIIYKDKDPFFPLFPAMMNVDTPIQTLSLSEEQQKKLKRAEKYEYVHKKFSGAIALYNELFISLKTKIEQARMLNHIARNSIKQKKYHQAIQIYNRIIKNYSDQKTYSNLPLLLIARLQKIECYQSLEDYPKAINEALLLYNKILNNSLHLNTDQLFSYADLLKEKLFHLLLEGSLVDTFSNEFDRLKSLHEYRLGQWQVIKGLRKGCVPELREKYIDTKPDSQTHIHYSKTIDQEGYLISAVLIPDQDKMIASGLLGIKIKNDFLERELLNEIIEAIQLKESTMIKIFTLSGKVVYGKNIHLKEFYKIAAFFDDNFPPWKIEISDTQSDALESTAIYKSFYFWTIITLIIVLGFGVVLIVRAVAHEMDVLKIKSDFVSSVSHEFKTPLTSIKALTERLLEDKVNNPVKMKQYFTVISQDTDRLTHLVGNILDFSKIEEGKKEYDFEEMDISRWLHQILENFRKENMQREIKINTKIPANIPYLKIDKSALARAIYNLLDNAIKFSLQKKEVELIVEIEEENVVIKVKDDGIGIPQNEWDKIFEKFYQGRNASKYSAKGTGLGLTLVKHTAEAHGGKISVESKEDQGSTFSLILPIQNNIE